MPCQLRLPRSSCLWTRPAACRAPACDRPCRCLLASFAFLTTFHSPTFPFRFECKSDGQYFAVQHVSLEPANGDVEDSAYTGPARFNFGVHERAMLF